MSRSLMILCMCLCAIPAWAQTPPALSECAQRLTNICQDTSQDPSVCKLFASPSVETRATIEVFFNDIESLPEQRRQDLICARFNSDKMIRGLFVSEGDIGSDRIVSRGITTGFSCLVSNMSAAGAYQQAVKKVQAYDGTVPAGPDLFDIAGTLKQVVEQPVGSSRTHHVVLDPCRIVRLYRNGEVVTFNGLAKEAKTLTREQYAKFMEAGLTPPDVTDFTAVPGDGMITLSWTHPAIPDFVGVRIVYRTDQYPSRFDEGALIVEGVGVAFTHADLLLGKTYYYMISVLGKLGRYSTGAYATASPTCVSNISGIVVDNHDGAVTISWKNPTCPLSSNILVTQRTDRNPKYSNDGDVVCRTQDTSCRLVIHPFGMPYYLSVFVPTEYDGTMYYRNDLAPLMRAFPSPPPLATIRSPSVASLSTVVHDQPLHAATRSGITERILRRFVRYFSNTTRRVFWSLGMVIVGMTILVYLKRLDKKEETSSTSTARERR